MGASVTLEAAIWSDVRFDVLAAAVGLAEGDFARIKVAKLWAYCTQRCRYDISPAEVIAVLGPGGPGGLVQAGLGRENDDGSIYLAGTGGRIEWLTELREKSVAGGRKRANTAKRGPDGRYLPQPDSSRPLEIAGPALQVPQPAQSSATTTTTTTTTTITPPIRPPRGAAADSGRSAARVIAAFNRGFERRLDPRGWEPTIRRALAKGFTEEQLIGVVWWAAEEWADDPEWRLRVSPKTLFKLQSSSGNRTLPEYLSLATELWRETHGADEPPPWERAQLALVVDELAEHVLLLATVVEP